MTNSLKDKVFMRKAIGISLPIMFQGLLNTTLQLVDNVMIGQLGHGYIGAVSLANKVFFVFTLLLFGIVSGSGILTAQYWGKREIDNIRRVLGMSLLLGVGASFLFLIPSLVNPSFIMSIFTPDKEVISIGASYLSIVAISFPFTAIVNAYVAILRGVNEVRFPVIITMIAIAINITLNYIFIFGNFGAPKLGVVGAALATLIARIIECSMLLIIVYAKKSPAAAKLKEMVSFTRAFTTKFFATVAPVIANEFMWGLGITMYSLAYGRMNKNAIDAIAVTQTVEQLFMVVFQGLSAATAVILGNILGANELKKADDYAKKFLHLQFILSVSFAILCFIIRNPIVHVFNVTQEIAILVQNCLIAFALYLPFKIFNYVNICGILRSGGDTKASLLLDTTGVWLIGVPLAFLGAIVWKLPIYLVYALVMGEEIYKMIFGYLRYRKKKWLKNIVIEK